MEEYANLTLQAFRSSCDSHKFYSSADSGAPSIEASKGSCCRERPWELLGCLHEYQLNLFTHSHLIVPSCKHSFQGYCENSNHNSGWEASATVVGKPDSRILITAACYKGYLNLPTAHNKSSHLTVCTGHSRHTRQIMHCTAVTSIPSCKRSKPLQAKNNVGFLI